MRNWSIDRGAVDTMQYICLKEAGVSSPLTEETTLIGYTFGGYLRSKVVFNLTIYFMVLSALCFQILLSRKGMEKNTFDKC